MYVGQPSTHNIGLYVYAYIICLHVSVLSCLLFYLYSYLNILKGPVLTSESTSTVYGYIRLPRVYYP